MVVFVRPALTVILLSGTTMSNALHADADLADLAVKFPPKPALLNTCFIVLLVMYHHYYFIDIFTL